MHPWLKGIQVCSNEGPPAFPRGDNYEIPKKKLKSSTPEPLGQYQPNSPRNHLWVKELLVCSNEGPQPFHRGDIYEIEKKY